MHLPNEAWGAILITLSTLAYFTGRLPRVRAIGVFVGILLTGINGHVVTIASHFVAWLARLSSGLFVWAFGVTAGVGGVILLAVGVYFLVHDLHPRGSAKKRTFWIAAAMALVIAAGATGFAGLNNLPGQVTQGITQSGV